MISVYPNDVNHSDIFWSHCFQGHLWISASRAPSTRFRQRCLGRRNGQTRKTSLGAALFSTLVENGQNRRVENSDRLADLAASECHMSHSAAGGRWWRMMDMDGDKKDDITYVESKRMIKKVSIPKRQSVRSGTFKGSPYREAAGLCPSSSDWLCFGKEPRTSPQISK